PMECRLRNYLFGWNSLAGGAGIGAVTKALVRALLQATVLFSTLHGHHGSAAVLASSKFVGSYIGSLFLAGLGAGVFGGMASTTLRRPVVRCLRLAVSRP
ncbi:MAG: hypothetical protein M3Y56_12615, partial [Armatimonadota bacterium]|nr:hypothetical protein [Armatimonadota bacterium]